jgi:hypothetical protein
MEVEGERTYMGEMKNAHTFFVGSPYGKIST